MSVPESQTEKTVAVVPARGGSKGIPRKNLQLLEGKPLVVHAIEAARASSRVDRLIVTTDDEEIAGVAESAGAEVLARPASLAADETPTMDVLRFVLERLDDENYVTGVVVLLEPTSPFRTGELVDRCIEKIHSGGARSVVTVTQLERSPYNIFEVSGDRAVRLFPQPPEPIVRRQDMARLKRVNGCVYAVRHENIRDGVLLADPIKVVEMGAEESINIDTPLDLEIARLCARRRERTARNDDLA